MSFDIAPLDSWLPGAKLPLIVAGPCSAETEEQVLQTAHALNKIPGVRMYRAGIWKPRTKPNSFEGVGPAGLDWLKKVKKQTQLLVTTEVANAEHAELCLKAGVDVVWIGARTTVNPFYVQEIADVLKGSDIAVMVKNPINPDVHLWLGAFERLSAAGLNKLIGIHRGFSTHEKSVYRNAPHWEIALELKRLAPNLPLICDPSHICGKRDLLFSVAQKALDLDMAGIMIETHMTPDAAWSDASQQITPDNLSAMLTELRPRNATSDNQEYVAVLDRLRRQIDRLDVDLLAILSSRMNVAAEIGEVKRRNNVAAFQNNRWAEVLKNRVDQGKSLGLDEEFINGLFQVIHQESLRKQT